MTIYHYNSDGQYLGSSDLNSSDKCPITGDYLIPAFTTTTAPPTISDGQQAYFIDGAWILRKMKQYCYYNNGLSYKEVNYDYVAVTGEVLFDAIATESQLTAAFSGYIIALKQQKLDALDVEYQPQFEALAVAYITAILASDTTTAAARQSDYVTLKAEYTTAREAITNGQ